MPGLLNMTLITSLSAINTQRLFIENYILYFEDPVVGKRVMEFRDIGFPIETSAGLEFYKQNVLQDQVSPGHKLLHC